jgi:hypothetical protein
MNETGSRELTYRLVISASDFYLLIFYYYEINGQRPAGIYVGTQPRFTNLKNAYLGNHILDFPASVIKYQYE